MTEQKMRQIGSCPEIEDYFDFRPEKKGENKKAQNLSNRKKF